MVIKVGKIRIFKNKYKKNTTVKKNTTTAKKSTATPAKTSKTVSSQHKRNTGTATKTLTKTAKSVGKQFGLQKGVFKVSNVKAGVKMKYTIVSESEADLRSGKISSETPIAQALLGHKVGDIVDAKTPRGIIQLEVLSISVG